MSDKTVDPFESVKTLEEEVVGMEKLAAIVKIENAGQLARIVAEDGEDFAVTMELRGDRLNLEIASGKVVSVHRG